MDLAEERGLGMKTLGSMPEKYGLPMPRYAFNEPFLELTIFRNPAAITRLAPGTKLSADEAMALQFLASKRSAGSPQLMSELKFDERKAQRVLKRLVDSRLVRRWGKGRATRYEITPGKGTA